MRVLLLLCLLAGGGAAAVTVFAEDGAFDELSRAVKRKTVEKLAGGQAAIQGHATGGACKAAADCAPGCTKGGREATCLSIGEVAACPQGNALPPGGLRCTCLTGVGRCGFAVP